MREFFFTDWEGPWVTTDFAYEISLLFFKNPAFFERLSQYDDYLSYIRKKKDYEAGDTLKLLSPFLLAFGVTSEKIREFSRIAVRFIPDARISIRYIKIKPVVISTSYRQFLEESARILGINQHLHGTEFNIEDFSVDKEDKRILKEAVDTIASLPEIKVKPGMRENEMDEDSMKSVYWLDEFFWKKMMSSSFRDVLEEVKAIGGERKKKIVRKYVENFDIEEIVAIGDSISDHSMLKWVKERDAGIAVSFNGNEYAIRNSDAAVVSDTTFGEVAIIDAFTKMGVEGLIEIIKSGNMNLIRDEIAKNLSNTKFYWLEDSDIEKVIEESEKMRRKLRGGAGKLA